ncbi:MAG: peptidoglycan editing factor PgeF [Bacteriovoracaceae bacterium]|nr:peptidoglycan editing factor PgeF [Bacteriovoracaceae bacterium]
MFLDNNRNDLFWGCTEKKDYKSSNHLMNVELFMAQNGHLFESIHIASQVHDNKVFVVGQKGVPDDFKEDALVTNQKNIAIVVRTADCLPILLYEARKKIIAVIHSGWRGTKKDIVTNTIVKMQDAFNAKAQDMIALLGPSIGSCCYQVGDEVACNFKEVKGAITIKGSSKYLDLSVVVKNSLHNNGVLQIEKIESCTCCNPDQYFSYRRDKLIQGYQYSIMMLC